MGVHIGVQKIAALRSLEFILELIRKKTGGLTAEEKACPPDIKAILRRIFIPIIVESIIGE